MEDKVVDTIVIVIIILYVVHCWVRLILYMMQPSSVKLDAFKRAIRQEADIKIKELIQRNINVVRMVIGSFLLVLGLLSIAKSFFIATYGGISFHITKPFYFSIGILLLISGVIILAKGVKEYLR